MPAVLRIAIPVPLMQVFDYLPPKGTNAGELARGCRVLVPFGRGRRVGVVIDAAAHSDLADDRLRRVLAVLDPAPLLTAELMDAVVWTSRYYHYPLGEVLHAALPAGLRSARAAEDGGERGFALALDPATMPRNLRAGTRTAQLLALLARGPLAATRLDSLLPGWQSAAGSLKRRGLIEPVRLAASEPLRARVAGPDLNAEQQRAVEAIAARRDGFAPVLLEGITGSGKTEVYLTLIEQVVAQGRQALVLVPEIGLTPQALRRFRERLPGAVAVLHSGLSDGERTRAWLAAARGKVQVILGTRSAVFTPLPNAGLIVVDEEHDASYKQHEGLRYNARDLAIVRAKALGVPIILGSATPSLETLANVEAGRYQCLHLGARAGAARLPQFRLVDLRGKTLHDGLAPELIAALRVCLARGEQALIFRNRRGYAPVLHCHSCGWHATCARCDKPLTWHRGAARLRCHHCGAEQRVPEKCPQCSNLQLNGLGLGTERLENNLAQLFPDVPVVRIDRETTRRKHAFDTLLGSIAPDRPGLLVGTQMLAKGHDLPNLTTVAIVGVDEGLFSVDFRASERLCQLIVQVSGRAGRALKPGTVWLQTHHPDHPLLRGLLRDGYAIAAQALLAERRETGLPPYAYLALLRAESSALAEVERFLQRALASGRTPDGVTLLGPMPAPMPRRAGLHRGQLLLSAEERSRLHAFLPGWLALLRECAEARRVRWSLDVDPIDLY
jgi:primosomal protein N' (replication factor Y) (superfamily II helicase)